jgi:hypothetical protein
VRFSAKWSRVAQADFTVSDRDSRRLPNCGQLNKFAWLTRRPLESLVGRQNALLLVPEIIETIAIAASASSNGDDAAR